MNPLGRKNLFCATLVALLVIVAPASARDYLTKDGQFTVCKWGHLMDCELLDATREKSLDLTKDERRVLFELIRFSAIPEFSGKDLVAVFGQPFSTSKEADGSFQVSWRIAAGDGDEVSAIGMAMVNQKMSVISYRIWNKYSIIWYAHHEH